MTVDGQAGVRKLWTPQFGVLLVCGFVNFLAMGAISPLVPRFAKNDLGASDFVVGLLVAVYAVSAILVRPFAAGISNRRGRRVLVVSGALVSACSMALYALAPNVAALVPARLLTGAGQALYFTGAATMVTELAPDDRRGEAVSYFSVAVYLGSGFGPMLGEWFEDSASIGWGFVAAALIALSAAIVGLRTAETLDPDREWTATRRFAFSKVALWPGAVLALGMVGNVAFSSFLPLYVDELGMGGAGLVFALYAVTIILVRVFGARLPDLLGPAIVGTAATVVIAVGMGLIAVLGSALGLYIGSVVFAIGISFHYPSLMALVVSRASAAERASVIGSFTAFFDLATGIGGLLVGSVVSLAGYRFGFGAASLCAVLGLVLLRTVVIREPSIDGSTTAVDLVPASGTSESTP